MKLLSDFLAHCGQHYYLPLNSTTTTRGARLTVGHDLIARALFKKKQFEAGPWIARCGKRIFLLCALCCQQYYNLPEKQKHKINLQFNIPQGRVTYIVTPLITIILLRNDLHSVNKTKSKQTMVEMTTNGSRRIEAWGSSSKNTKNKHRCKHICAVISLICGFALVILGILIVLFFRDLVDKVIKSVSLFFLELKYSLTSGGYDISSMTFWCLIL